MEDRLKELPYLRLLAKIGEGGMSTVWKAEDKRTGAIVAVKILKREFAGKGEEVRAFRTEERIMEKIRHPGIVAAYDFVAIPGSWCLVMEYVDGYTFADLLRRKQHVSEGDCLLICESVAAALDYAWNDYGIVHCDIKPENLMINSEGVVKLTDLGISYEFSDLEDGAKEVPDHVCGTPDYISPEQVYGDVELDCRTDIYSLGATLYHLSTGRTLFPGLETDDVMRAHCDENRLARDPRLYRPKLSEGFAQLLEAMLVKNRASRVASWQDVIALCQDVERRVAFKPRTTEGNSSIRLV